MDRLQTTIRPYAWGSRTVLAELQGRPTPSEGPEAELWAGAHPGAPSRLERDGREQGLDEVIEADPDAELGARVVGEFGARLPFLLKILAVEQPLSLQAHPNREQARAGFAAEEEAGIPRDAPFRNYRDPSPKPEMLYAVTPFEALCGFRSVGDTVQLLDRVLARGEVTWLAPYVDRLRAASSDPASALREVVTDLMRVAEPDLRRRVAAVRRACAVVVSDATDLADPDIAVFACVARLAEQHPGDLGVVVALLMNHVRLAPGEAMFLAAGNLHAYLHGVGVEVLANSDNVLRGGLTAKHIDRDALLAVLRFDAGPVPPVTAAANGPGIQQWTTGAPEFSLARAEVVEGAPVVFDLPEPRIMLCLEGAVLATSGDTDALDLRAGDAAFVSASDPPVTITGHGVVVIASPGISATLTS